MMKNGEKPPAEPADYQVVTVTLEVSRTGWEVAERFAQQYGVEPLRLVEQAVEQRLGLLMWLMNERNQRVVS